MNSQKYKQIFLTVDIVIFSAGYEPRKVLLIKRKNDPFRDRWAIPGGFVDYDESLEAAARRELYEETGVDNAALRQVRTFGKPGRDPRGRTVSVIYAAAVEEERADIKAGDDAKEAAWFDIADLPELAFDHEEILKFTIDFLEQKK